MKSHTLSQSKTYVFIAKHMGKILFCSILLMFIVAIVGKKDFGYMERMSHIAILICILGFFVEIFSRKIAYKVVIDFENRTIKYYMCRSNQVKIYDFNDIKKIIIKNYVTFIFENSKILYHPSEDIDYKNILKKLLKEAAAPPAEPE